MKLLLTNDDGFDAPGLQTLASVLRREHEVWIVAPLHNKSGASSCINMWKELYLERRAQNEFALDGTPTDCVLSSLSGDFLPSRPDAIISGINKGYNLGTDIVYSGTCGAARQAALTGIPGIALSTDKNPLSGDENEYNYGALAEFALKNLKNLLVLCGKIRNIDEGMNYEYFINVNAPSIDSYKGEKFTKPCRRFYCGDHTLVSKGADGKTYSNCVGGGDVRCYGDEFSDAKAVAEGYVSISVLYAEPAVNTEFCKKTFC
ncbi:MAG: 5'/3'-nucleotidase SurE [Treponema sp.]|nr:5'/3'-nucleotidase SurE [Treponema sp.]